MDQPKRSTFFSTKTLGVAVAIGLLITLLGLPVYAGVSLAYSETKGPFKNWTQVVDLEGDGDLDVIISHTRWEADDISWAGIGRWINQGDGTFELLRDDGLEHFAGFAAGAGDVDQDGDPDIFAWGFQIRLLVNQGGQQAREPGSFLASGGINFPPAFNQGYRDMGGTITLGDLNGDGRIDAFVAGCCYGLNLIRPGADTPHAPALSWVWINDTVPGSAQTGHLLPLDALDGRPIRKAALGDLDGDGDLDIFAAVGQPTLGTSDALDDVVLLNDGTGQMAVYNQPLGDTDSTSVALGDVNGDGLLDALVGTNDGAKLWINQGAERGSDGPLFVLAPQSFAVVQAVTGRIKARISAAADSLLGVYLPTGSVRTKAVFLADLDGDDDLDALLARIWGAEIWLNDGLGDFRPADIRFEHKEDTGVAVADFDGDGDPDIFTGRNEPTYQVWWNNGQGVFQAGSR